MGMKEQINLTGQSRRLDALLFLWCGPSLPSPNQLFVAYCVWEGNKIGVFTSWTDVKVAMGPGGRRCKGYHSVGEAVLSFQEELNKGADIYRAALRQQGEVSNYFDVDTLRSSLPVQSPPITPQRRQGSSLCPQDPISSPVRCAQAPSQPDALRDDTFYIVERGLAPGVYQGKLNAWKAAGPDLSAIRYPVNSEEAAWRTFGILFMANRIQRLEQEE